jgi:hypothetical protein
MYLGGGDVFLGRSRALSHGLSQDYIDERISAEVENPTYFIHEECNCDLKKHYLLLTCSKFVHVNHI